MPRKAFQNQNSNKKQNALTFGKCIKKQSKNSFNFKSRYAIQDYQELKPLSPDELIEQQEQLLDCIKTAKEDAIDEQIQVIPIYEAKKNAINYEYEPLYIVNFSDQDGKEDLHVVHDWKLCQSSIKCFSEQQQQLYEREYRNGNMVEPKRKIYLTDRQLEIAEQALYSALTDGIAEQLRQKYLKGFVPKDLSNDQKKVFDNFVKYPALYSIVLLNQETSVNKQAFQKEHLLPANAKIHKRPNDDSEDLCSIILNFKEIAAYYNFQKYFIQNKFEVLTNQRFNKTQEILNILRDLYKSEFEMKKDQEQKMNSIPLNKDNNFNEKEKHADFHKNNSCSNSLEIEIEQIAESEKQDVSPPSSHQKEKNLVTEEEKINQVLKNINMIIKLSNRQIKQQFRFSKGQFNIEQLKMEYQNFLDQITKSKAANQEYKILAQKFLIDFHATKINKTLTSICRGYKIDGLKLII